MKLCKCGCGQPAPIAKRCRRLKDGTLVKRGGQMDYIKFHHTRLETNINHIRAEGAKLAKQKPKRRIDSHGYVDIKMPDHPNAKSDGYIKEHRLVMSSHLGRPLTPKETIHHINGIKTDNRIDNLEIVTASEHNKIHDPLKRLHNKHRLKRQKILEFGFKTCNACRQRKPLSEFSINLKLITKTIGDCKKCDRKRQNQ